MAECEADASTSPRTRLNSLNRERPELLGYWVREHKIMSLEEAQWRRLALSLRDVDPFGSADGDFASSSIVHAGRARQPTEPVKDFTSERRVRGAKSKHAHRGEGEWP
jgi:hypothetical protein